MYGYSSVCGGSTSLSRLYYGGQAVLTTLPPPTSVMTPLPSNVPSPQLDNPSAVLIAPPAAPKLELESEGHLPHHTVLVPSQ